MTARSAWCLAFALGGAMAACSGSSAVKKSPRRAAIPKASADPGLATRAVFSGNPDCANVQISPDGKTLSWLAPNKGVMNLYLAPFEAPEKAAPLTQVEDRPLEDYLWAYDGQHVLYFKDSGGDENFRLYAVDVKTRETRNLVDVPSVRVRLIKASPKRPSEILVGINERDPRHHDVYRVELKSARRTLVFKNEAGYLDFIGDEDLAVRFASLQTEQGGLRLYELKKGAPPAVFSEVTAENVPGTELWRLDSSGRTLYMADPRGRDTAAAVALDVARKKASVLAEDNRADVVEAVFAARTSKLIAASVAYERRVWKVVDRTFASDFDLLKRALKGDFRVNAQSLDDQRWIVREDSDQASPRYLGYDRRLRKLTPLFAERRGLEGVPLARTVFEVVKARDGLPLLTYVSLPPGSDPDEDGRPRDPVPTVLLVHGGGRESWGYSSVVQWLASRGYAVVRPNYRGSRGLGKKLSRAGQGEWGRLMQADVADVARWAVDQSIAEEERVAVFGAGYGGYAALLALTEKPEAFACGVEIGGPSRLVTMLDSLPVDWAPQLELVYQRVGGDPRTDDGRKLLELRSPLKVVDRIRRPVLVGQGANDPVVRQAESDQLVAALEEKQRAVTYVLFPDEGRHFARAENRLAFDAVSEAFLAECLGGRYQPIGGDLRGASMRVPAGADRVVGLRSALEAALRRKNAVSQR